ncbi:hypothetical protein JZ751_018064, partial [Albula glossodonta]
KPDTMANATTQTQTPVARVNIGLQSAKFLCPQFILQSNIIKKAMESRHQMRQRTCLATGISHMHLPVQQVTPMFNNAKTHPLRCSTQPEIGKKMVEKSQQTDQVKAGKDVGTVAQAQAQARQVTARQVVAMMNNPKLLQLKCGLLPDIRKKAVESSRPAGQKEKSKGSTQLKPSEDMKSIPNKPEKKTGVWRRLTLPLTPAAHLTFVLPSVEALKYFQDKLTRWEQKEILDFTEIWYLGLGAEKKEPPENSEEDSSSHYDDAKGIYTPVLRDHIAYRFEILERLGQGSFGLVMKCLDHKTKELVAVKVIHNMKSANRLALKELEILDIVRREDETNCYNVIHMKEHLTFRKHLCIVFELQGMDLYRLIRNNHFQGFTLTQTHHYASALVTSLQMLHKQKIIHCDLKPVELSFIGLGMRRNGGENILLSEKKHGKIKVADFGCSFYEHQKAGYTYVQTRFYRAPEVILGFTFGTAIDIWSLGCILAELHTGTPIFSGINEVDQLACIIE